MSNMFGSSFPYETHLPDLGEKPNQPISFNFSKNIMALGPQHIVHFSQRGLSNCPVYHMIKKVIGHFFCCVQAVRQRGYLLTGKTNDMVSTQH